MQRSVYDGEGYYERCSATNTTVKAKVSDAPQCIRRRRLLCSTVYEGGDNMSDVAQCTRTVKASASDAAQCTRPRRLL